MSWVRVVQSAGTVLHPCLHQGEIEAQKAAQALIATGITHFDVAFSSYLKRAIKTLWIVLEEMDLMWIPQRADWRFNERHYGDLQGKNKEGDYYGTVWGKRN